METDKKCVGALGAAAAPGCEDFSLPLTSSTLLKEEQRLVLGTTEQAKQDEQVKQQQAPSVEGGEEDAKANAKKGVELVGLQQQQQRPQGNSSLLLCCSSKEAGIERREGGRRKDPRFSLASLMSEEGEEEQQRKGGGDPGFQQQRCRGKAELCDDDDEEEQQQLPSTVDSVASSTDSTGLGGGYIATELCGTFCGTSSAAAAAFSMLTCAKKLCGLPSTPLLVAAVTPEKPILQALCDSPAVLPSPLPLPSPLKKCETTNAVAGGTEATAFVKNGREKDGGGTDTFVAGVATALGTANEGGQETEEDAGATLACGETQEKANEEEEKQTLEGSALTTTAVVEEAAVLGSGAAVPMTTTTTEAAVGVAGAEIERVVGQGRREVPAKGGDAHGKLSTGKEKETAIMSFRVHSRRKQSVAEQGRIAAAAVAAATHLFSRGDTARRSSISSLPKEEQQQGIKQQQEVQKRSVVDLEEMKTPFSPAAACHKTYGLLHPLQEQNQQEQGEGEQQQPQQHPKEGEEIGWRQHSQGRQEDKRSLPFLETGGRTRERVPREQQQQQTEEQQERQQGRTPYFFTQLLASDPGEEEKNMLRLLWGAEEGEAAATAESPALLLSHRGHLNNRSTNAEQDQQQLQQVEKLWAGSSDSEAEARKRTLLDKTYLDSPSSSVSSLLQQQQAEAPTLLFSAAALQHEVSTKNSSVATFTPRKGSHAGNVAFAAASAAAAISREITDALASAASRDERTMCLARGDLEAPREQEIGDYAGFQEEPTGHKEINALLSASERDVMLLMDLPRVLSLATQSSSPDRTALDYPQPQQAAAFSAHKNYNSPAAAIAAHYAASASGSGGDAATAARAASLHAFSPAVAPSRGASETVPHQQQAGACLSREKTAARIEEAVPSPVPSLCLQAAMRPPPGLDTRARACVTQELEHVLRSNNSSGISSGVPETAPTILSSSSGRRHSAAAALLASATQESLAAAVAALAAAAPPPVDSPAVVPTGTADGGGGLSPTAASAADVCRRGCLFSADDILRVAAAAAAADGGGEGNCCSSNMSSGRADVMNAESSISRGTTTASSFFAQRKSSSGSSCTNPLYDTASKHFLLTALAREAAAGTARPGGAGGVPLAAAASAARQQGLAALGEGEQLRLSQTARVGGGGGEAAAVVGRGGSCGGFPIEAAATGGLDRSRLYVPSYQGGLLRGTASGEYENRAEFAFARKQQVMGMGTQLQNKQSETQLQLHHEGDRLVQRCGRETEAAGGRLRLFDAAAAAATGEGRTGGRAGTEGRETVVEDGRAVGCAASVSAFSSKGGGRGYGGAATKSSVGRQAWLRKGEHLELFEQQQQQQLQRGGGTSRSTVYGRGLGDRSSRKGAGAARAKPIPEPKKDGFKVFFGNASALTTDEEMYGLFRQYGECSELILLRDRRQRLRGAGFVTFKNAADAMRAIDGLDRRYTVLGGTKPLEVRVPENSEQKRERIRALARLRAENAQQQSQSKQQQPQANQQHTQQEYHTCPQQLQQVSLQQQYTQQQRSLLLSQHNQQRGGNVLQHVPHFTATAQGQQHSQQPQQYSGQQQLLYYNEQQHRRAPMQSAQQHQQHVYYEQQQRWAEPLQGGDGYVLGNEYGRGKEITEELLWQSGNARRLSEALRESVLCSPKGEKKSEAAASPPHPTTALEALLAAAAATQQQHQTQQSRQQDHTNRLAAGIAESAQGLLEWLEGYPPCGEGGGVVSALADQQQQQKQMQSRLPEPPHAIQQKESASTSLQRPVLSLFHEPGKTSGRDNTLLQMGSTADQIVAACVGKHHPPEEEDEYWKEAFSFSPGISRGSPSATLSHALAAAFPSPKTSATKGMLSDRISCSTATPTGGSAWQGPRSTIMDQNTIASPVPSAIAAARDSPAVQSPSSSGGVDALPATLSRAASDGIAPATAAAAGAGVAVPRSGTSPPACEKADLSYVNAVASVLSGRTFLPSECAECDSGAPAGGDSLSSRAAVAPTKYATSSRAYSRLAPSDAAFLQSASTASPAVFSPFLASFAGVEKPGRVPDDGLRGSKAPAAATAVAGATALSSSAGGRMRLAAAQQQDGGSRFHADMCNASGKSSESWTNNSSLQETD